MDTVFVTAVGCVDSNGILHTSGNEHSDCGAIAEHVAMAILAWTKEAMTILAQTKEAMAFAFPQMVLPLVFLRQASHIRLVSFLLRSAYQAHLWYSL